MAKRKPKPSAPLSRPGRRINKPAPAMVGFETLWNRLVNLVQADLIARFPEQVEKLRDAADATNLALEERLQAQASLSLELGIRVSRPHRRALEVAAKHVLGERKLVVTLGIAQGLTRVPASSRQPGLPTILVDHCYVLLHAHLESIVKLWEAVVPLVIDKASAKVLGVEIAEWSDARKADIAKPRNAVAHPNTVWMRAINEDGLWEPLIVLGLGEGAGAAMAKEQFDGDNRSFEYRIDVLRQITAIALAFEDKCCGALASHLATKDSSTSSLP